MKKYIFVVLLVISSNICAVDIFVNCSSNLHLQGISTQVAQAINNICSNRFLGDKALFTLTPEYLPSSFYKKIYEDNFYIFDAVSDTIYLTFNKFMSILYLQTPSLNKEPIIFGSDIEKAPNYPWLNNWFNVTKSVGSVNALVKTNTDYLNYFFEGVTANQDNLKEDDHENTYKHALIGVCIGGVILLVATNLITYLYMKNRSLKEDRKLLLGSESNESINPI